jgi:hypothetical protein
MACVASLSTILMGVRASMLISWILFHNRGWITSLAWWFCYRSSFYSVFGWTFKASISIRLPFLSDKLTRNSVNLIKTMLFCGFAYLHKILCDGRNCELIKKRIAGWFYAIKTVSRVSKPDMDRHERQSCAPRSTKKGAFYLTEKELY